MSAASHATHESDHAHGHGEHHSPAHYKKIWATLLVLLVISVLGPELGVKVVTLLTAFGIAFVKAYLVIKHFMHIDEELPVVRYILVVGVALMGMMFAAVSVDVMNHDGARWSNEAAKRAVVEGMLKGDTSGHHEAAGAGAAGHPATPGAGAAPAGH